MLSNRQILLLLLALGVGAALTYIVFAIRDLDTRVAAEEAEVDKQVNLFWQPPLRRHYWGGERRYRRRHGN